MSTLTEPPTADFDPAHVPVFPVITVEILDGGTLLVDGQQRNLGGEPPTDAAVAAAAEAIRRRGLTHARVAAVLDDTTYTMIVGADGERFEIPATPVRRPLWRRPWFIPTVVMLMTLIAATATVTVSRQLQQTEAVAPTQVAPTAPTPTELPVLPPDGWTTHATWFANLRGGNQPAIVATDGVVAAVTPDNQLVGLDPATGAASWTADLGRAGITQGPVHTKIDGQESIAVVTTRGLAWWPLSGGTARLHELELPPRATASFDGGGPLITLPDQHAATVVDGVLSDRIVPAGARAVRADDAVITAVDAAGRLWRLVNDAPRVPDPVGNLKPPKKGSQPKLLGTGGAVIVVRWEPAGVIAAHSLTGALLASAPDRGHYGPWYSDRQQISVASGYAVTLGPRPRLTPITAGNWRTTRVASGRVYGSVSGAAAQLGPKGAPLPHRHPTAVAPVAVDARHAYVIATAGGAPVLYALEPD